MYFPLFQGAALSEIDIVIQLKTHPYEHEFTNCSVITSAQEFKDRSQQARKSAKA